MRLAFVLWSFCIVLTAAAQSDTVLAVSNDEFAQQETTIAISRTDPKLIVVGSNDDAMDVRSMPAYVTTDGGKSWDTYRLPKAPSPYHTIGDPVLIADNDGGFYYAYLLNSTTAGYNILVAHSSDGKSWTYNNPVISEPSGAFEDKEWLGIDRSPASPTYGRLYVTWTRLHPGIASESGTFIAWSDDTGKTWTEPKRFGSFVGTYTQIQVGKSGEIFVSYSQFSEELDSIGHYLSVSNDFGQTFTQRRVATFINYPFSLGNLKSTLKNGRLVSFPYLSFTLDDRDPRTMHAVYGSYDTARKAAIQQYIFSTDDGVTWSSPRIIGNPSTLDRDRFQPWISFDPVKQIPHVFYYSSEQDEKNLLSSPFKARILPDTILAEQIGDTTFNPLATLDLNNTPFIGDYTGADICGRTFAASWTQNRAGFTDGEIFVYVDPNIDSLTGGVVITIRRAKFMIAAVSPNPASTHCQIYVRSREHIHGSLEIIDLRSTVLYSISAEIGEGESMLDLLLPPLPAGSYFLRLRTASGSAVEKIVIRP